MSAHLVGGSGLAAAAQGWVLWVHAKTCNATSSSSRVGCRNLPGFWPAALHWMSSHLSLPVLFFLIKFGLRRPEMSRWRWSCNKIGQLSWNLWSNSGNNVFFFVPNMVWFPSVTRVYSSMGWLWVYTGTLKSQLHFEMQHNRPNDIVKGK